MTEPLTSPDDGLSVPKSSLDAALARAKTKREKLRNLREALDRVVVALKANPTNPEAPALWAGIEAVHDKLFDDLDAAYAFFTEPEPQSLRVSTPKRGVIQDAGSLDRVGG